MLIGELARAAGMTVEGVRFYERSGLLPPAGRSGSGYRLYGPDALERVAFIRQAQAIGLSLDEIRRVLALSQAGVRPCKEVEAFMRGKVAEIDRRLHELRALKRRLTDTLVRWEAEGGVGRGGHVCALIEATSGPQDQRPGRRQTRSQDRGRRARGAAR